MKTLVTHINPHLDDIAAIWLFVKFHPDFKEPKIEFISASREAGLKGESEDRVFVGTGGGKYDEHKEGLETCAASLVHDDFIQKGLIGDNELTKKALEKLIAWNRLVDTGKAPESEFDEFSVQSFIRTKDSNDKTSQKSVELGIEILNRILEVLKRKEQSIMDWEKRVEFESSLGKGYGVISSTVNREFCREQDGDIYLMYDPRFKSVQFFTPSSSIDLEALYNKLTELDTQASWFLHQSHHMVLCGSSSAPESKPTTLSFDQLIEVVKTI